MFNVEHWAQPIVLGPFAGVFLPFTALSLIFLRGSAKIFGQTGRHFYYNTIKDPIAIVNSKFIILSQLSPALKVNPV
jgi:hypothetical protein